MISMYPNTVSFYIKTSGKTSMCQLTRNCAWKEVSSDSLGNFKKKKQSANINTGYAVPQVLCFHSCFLDFSYFQTAEPCLIPEAENSQEANAFWLTSHAHHITLLTTLGSALGDWGFTSLEEAILPLSNSSQSFFVQEHCIILLVLPSVYWGTSDTSSLSTALILTPLHIKH